MAITFKKISGDTEVLANPVLDGTETALSGLQIDGVKYAMGGGKERYRHVINMTGTKGKPGTFRIIIDVELPTSKKLTETNLIQSLADHFGNQSYIPASGYYGSGVVTFITVGQTGWGTVYTVNSDYDEQQDSIASTSNGTDIKLLVDNVKKI